ncbi:MAG: class I tRNA ligase family protein, partial [Candidatus Paceibacterota bacterium]
VRRKGGWDTHGLPVELQVEKQLGLKSKKEIEEYGIANFNQKCKESVWEYLEYWNKFTERIGYWVDQVNPYVTYHNSYIESVWNVIKQVDKQNLLFKDYKVVPWCPRCGTTLSSHELAQGYEDVKDLSVYVKFKVIGQENTYILAWTTTPWTLPGNVALAVGKDIEYIKIKKENEVLILAKTRLSIIDSEYKIIEELKGKDLIGLEYEPLYPYFGNIISQDEKIKLEKAFKVYEANFVTTEDGTGVVHTAVMYGVDDFNLGNEIGLPKHHIVGLDGKFLMGMDFLEGRFVRDEDVAVDIIKNLAHRGLLFKKEKYEHSYPHCWRCHTALIYYARDSWYIRMSSLRDKLVKENEGINWEPDYIKEGRFGEWLREVKDWAISRERYWGTPLPVWTCDKCKKIEIIGGIEDLKSKTKKSGNKYFVMRHGEAENNVLEICSTKIDNPHHLTEKGKKQVEEAAKTLIDKKIDMIFFSPFLRTKETTNMVAKIINFPESELKEDLRLVEASDGVFDGASMEKTRAFYKENYFDHYDKAPECGESLLDVKRRVGEFIYEIENKYQNKNILIIAHEGVGWALFSCINGFNKKETIVDQKNYFLLKNAEIREFDFTPIPHNNNHELDLHKPFIDDVELVCKCGEKLERSKEVMDVWLDSGTMPFSQDHYPFENKELINGKGYPADFISEAIDQTRGWFYTLHAVGVLMGKGKAYKNVISLGHLLDANGKKMSKSLGNVVDPEKMIEKYGVDTLRLWMYSVNQPGESKNFDEKTVLELHRQFFGLLYNVLAFYELYRDKDLEISLLKEERGYGKRKSPLSQNILDQWIIAKLNELIILSTEKIDNYKLLEPVRAIKDFIGDLSTWYLRRSRERIKNDEHGAKQTLYFVLKNLAKLMAPFAPFAAEDIWQKLKIYHEEGGVDGDIESVHLVNWVSVDENEIDGNLILEMENVRKIVTLGLQARQKESIPVRQPLQRLEVVCDRLDEKYFEIIKDELNIKEIKFTEGNELNIKIDTTIGEELRVEGQYRELTRAIQDMRKKMGLTPSDVISLFIQSNEAGNKIVEKFENEIKRIVLAEEIKYDINDGEDIKIGDLLFKVQIIKK